ncbi:MarR family winged helix-turn-helix transcriptional regulator [Allorhizobium sp. BGMRC 0089]|uniref:MarR family winged helix-turn-helix transcriptional regulator n=1 Tax=Allorhizobium sonneratiae TaxID=2934936 RepID=UPI0020338881|nr:MarR family winged helix-turn-helix transcriptional regulator [Allorhizobium sonneratiae]MCM2292163.1 MarR family winged helix-turn-helix transcriptional regulator [Allorhizobium sonneratiae]
MSCDNGTAKPTLTADQVLPVQYGELNDILGFHLRLANVALFQDYQATMGDLSLTPKQFAVLELILINPGTSQIGLAQSLRMDKATMMAIINKLEARNAIERRQSKIDRRRQELFVTEDGQKLVDTARQLRSEHEARFTTRFSADELKMLFGFLNRIYAGAKIPAYEEDEA